MSTPKERILQAVVEHLASELVEADEARVKYREMLQVSLAQQQTLAEENAWLRRKYEAAREDLRTYTAEKVMS